MDAFELDAQQRVATLEWIPQAMRTRMDLAGVRISLADWQLMTLAQRGMLAEASTHADVDDSGFVALLRQALGRAPALAAKGCNPRAPGLDSVKSH